jgi:ribosome recycling factor
MTEDVELIIDDARESMQKAINHLEVELSKIRAGKATGGIVDGIFVDYYGTPTAISQVANITVLDAKTVSIQPWEKNMISPIERAIMQANIGITPQSDGNQIRLFLPPLTEERRKELVKESWWRRGTF